MVFGDLYGDLWRLNAADGTSRNGTNTPLFAFSSNKHPIGAVPAIYNNGGQQFAVVASGGYADPTVMSWTASTQYLIAARLSSTAATSNETTAACSTCALVLNTMLSAGDSSYSQALIVGTQVFVTADASDVNLSAYGSASNTGHVIAANLNGPPSLTTVAISAGASSLVNSATTLYSSSSTQQQLLAISPTSTTGATVDFAATPKLVRMLWLPTQ